MAAIDSLLLSTVPGTLMQNLRREAQRDAECVIGLLEVLGIRPPSKSADGFCLPADFLLGLGAWARLLRWEAIGITLHLDMGIGSAQQVLRDTFLGFAQIQKSEEAPGPSLWARLIHLSARRLACTGQDLINAEVLLTTNESEEDAMLDGLAQFLWQNRHHGRQNEA